MPDLDRSDTTRAAVLEAALDLFIRQGYHGTSMRQIAPAAGVVPGAIYNHFPSKKALYLTLLQDANLYAGLAEAFNAARGESAEELLRDGAHRAVTALSGRGSVMPLFMLDVLEFGAANLATLAHDAMPAIIGFFGRAISLGSQRGELKPVRPDVLVRAFLGLFASYVITTRFLGQVIGQFPGLDLNADLVDDLFDILAFGILTQRTEGEDYARRSKREADQALRQPGGGQRPDAGDQ